MLHSHELSEALKAAHLFAGLSEPQLEQTLQYSHLFNLVEGESLFCQGDDVVSFYLVLSGRIKLFRVSPEGKEKVVDIVEQGDTFAEALMFMDHPHYPVNATALAPSKVVAINSNNFKEMLHNSVGSCFQVMGNLSVRLRSLIHEIDTLSLDSGTSRIAAYLVHLGEKHGNRYLLEIAKSVIASRLSVKPETFSRILRSLHEQNILTINGREVTIHDLSALKTFCSLS